MKKPHRNITLTIAVVYFVCVLLVVFWPSPVDRPASSQIHVALAWFHSHGLPRFVGYAQIEFTANIVMFIPMGYIISSWLRRTWMGVALGALVSLSVEVGQALFFPARFASGLDVLANTLGAVLGVAVYFWIHRNSTTSLEVPASV